MVHLKFWTIFYKFCTFTNVDCLLTEKVEEVCLSSPFSLCLFLLPFPATFKSIDQLFLFNLFHLFHVCGMGIFPTHVPVYHVDAGPTGAQKRASDPIGLELQMVMWLLGMNLGPLQEESVLLTPVLFVRPYIIQAGLKVPGSTDPSDSGSYGPGTTSSK